jgi:hypothetical protein
VLEPSIGIKYKKYPPENKQAVNEAILNGAFFGNADLLRLKPSFSQHKDVLAFSGALCD